MQRNRIAAISQRERTRCPSHPLTHAREDVVVVVPAGEEAVDPLQVVGQVAEVQHEGAPRAEEADGVRDDAPDLGHGL